MSKMIALIISAILCILPLSRSCCEVVKVDDSDIAWLMELYGYSLPATVIQTMHASFAPQIFPCGDVQITLTEILYDGIWLYTAATAVPTHPETTLIMPGSAELNDFIAGGYGEDLREDSRSFEQAAIQDGKDIIRVFLYPTEFYDASYYYLDHRQDVGSQSTLLGGAPGNWMDENMTIHLYIQLDHIDVAENKSRLPEIYEFPVEIKRLGSVESKIFRSVQDDDTPVTLVELVQTPLTVYANIQWKNKIYRDNAQYTLLNNSLEPFERGAPPDGNTYSMAKLPQEIYIKLNTGYAQEQESILPFSAIEDQ